MSLASGNSCGRRNWCLVQRTKYAPATPVKYVPVTPVVGHFFPRTSRAGASDESGLDGGEIWLHIQIDQAKPLALGFQEERMSCSSPQHPAFWPARLQLFTRNLDLLLD